MKFDITRACSGFIASQPPTCMDSIGAQRNCELLPHPINRLKRNDRAQTIDIVTKIHDALLKTEFLLVTKIRRENKTMLVFIHP